jgi:AI-2 transport protein TqsA
MADRHEPSATTSASDRPNSSLALGLIAFVIGGAALRELSSILVPFVLAVFLLFLVEATSHALRARFRALPRWAGLTTGVLIVLIAFAGTLWILAAQAAAFVGQAAALTARADAALAMAASWIGAPSSSLVNLIGTARLESLAGAAISSLRSFVGGAGLVAMYLGFLLASRRALSSKFVRLFSRGRSRDDATRIVASVRAGTVGYIWVQTITGLGIAIASWAVMAAFGLENAAVLALLVLMTSYIPVIGPALGVLVPPLFALGQFDGWGTPLLLAVVLQAINFGVNNILTPKIQSEQLNLDPTVVLLSLGLWGYLWGLPGALLSTPLTVMIMSVTAAVPKLRWIAVLLSREGDPLSAERP